MMGFVHQGLYFKVTGRNAAEAPITTDYIYESTPTWMLSRSTP